MNFTRRSMAAGALLLAVAISPLAVTTAQADPRSELAAKGISSLHQLEASEPRSRFFAHHARAVLVFPSVLKAGFVFGGESGDGVLLVDGRPVTTISAAGPGACRSAARTSPTPCSS